MENILKYFKRVGLALSVLFNVVLGGSSNQTFSARNYEWKRNSKLNIVWILDKIFFMDENHSMNNWSYWILRKDNK